MNLALYEHFAVGLSAADQEAWRDPHREARGRRDLEKRMTLAVEALDGLVESYEGWRESVIEKPELYDEDVDGRALLVFRSLMRAFDSIARSIESAERSGCEVSKVAEFKASHHKLANFLTPHSQFFSGPAFEEFTQQAIRSYEEGKTVTPVNDGRINCELAANLA